MVDLKGKNALVTGGARGIGAKIADDFAKAGANVLINYTSDSSASKAQELVKQMQSHGVKAHAIKADMASRDIGQVFLKEALSFFGQDAKIDIICHNAGVARNAPLEDYDLDDALNQYAVNVHGPTLLTQALLPHIRQGGGGRIIFVSSVSARGGYPQQTVYGGTKAAVEHLVRCWNNEFGREKKICVTAVTPGPINTDMWQSVSQEFKDNIKNSGIPIAEPSEISDVVLFLASDKSRWVTGCAVSTNGGVMHY